MKKNDIYEEIGNISPDLIAEADPTAPIVMRGMKIRRTLSVIAACFVVFIVSSCLWLFVPYSIELPEELKAFEGSEYYDVWLKTFLYKENRINQPNNNYEKYLEPKIFDFYKNLHKDEQQYSNYASDSVSNLISPSINSNYVEVTDNQFEGIIEPDYIKRTDKHIFYLGEDDVIYCYSIEGDESKCLGIYDAFKDRGWWNYTYEFFLTEDCKNLIVIDRDEDLRIVVIDVSDPANMKESAVINVGDALYVTSRINDGKLIFAYNHSITRWEDGKEPNSITVSRLGTVVDTIAFEQEDIVVPYEIISYGSLFLLEIDIESFTVENKIGLVSEERVLAITDDYIITRYSYTETDDKIIDTYPCAVVRAKSRISVVGYGEDGFEYLGSCDFDGDIVGRYAVDVKDNVLRVVTTSGSSIHNYVTLERSVADVSCDLWCYDLKKDKMIATVRNFAPKDEDVKSVRFDGDTAYVCTAKMDASGIYIDPVYFFDLSDYKNIKSIDTGNIEGYSELLKPFGEGFLIGIGRADDSKRGYNALKIEIYEDKGDRVEPICAYVRDLVNFSLSTHSYYFDAEKGYIGFALYDWGGKEDFGEYLLLQFDGEKFVTVIEEIFDEDKNKKYSYGSTRSVMIDGYLYIMYNDDFRVRKIG